MRRILTILFLIMISLNGVAFAQSKLVEQVLVSFDETQANALAHVIEYYKANYSTKIYDLIVLNRGDNMVFQFTESPIKNSLPFDRSQECIFIEIIYSKKLSKIIKAKRFYSD